MVSTLAHEVKYLLNGLSDAAKSFHIEEILGKLYAEDGAAFELRAITEGGKTETQTFWHDQLRDAVDWINARDGKFSGLYVSLNPGSPEVLHTGGSLNNNLILRRRYLVIDCDPKRPKGYMATMEERDHASKLAKSVMDHLSTLGWTEPLIIDTGSGFHLYYRIDLPSDSPLLRRVLRALSNELSSEKAQVDISLSDAARIVKLPGTMVCKGQNTPERPHRLSQVLSWPKAMKVVPTAQLQELADLYDDDPVPEWSPKNWTGPSCLLPTIYDRKEIKARARNYLERMDPAVSGKGGHNQTFKVACKLVRDFGLGFDDAWEELQIYNKKCAPDWDDWELEHKLKDADNYDGPRGGMVSSFTNYKEVVVEENGNRGEKKEKIVRQGRPCPKVAEDLLCLGGDFPKSAYGRLFALTGSGKPYWLDTPNQLFAWASTRVPKMETSQLFWAEGSNMITKGELHAFLESHVEEFQAVELYPHHRPLPGHFYVPHPRKGGDGRQLNQFLDFFRPASAVDASLLKAAALTLFWGGQYGQRPAFVFASREGDPAGGFGSGKTTTAEGLASLAGGSICIRQSEDIKDITVRLLSPDAWQYRTILLDNVKSERFSWEDLESMVTARMFSGRRLYKGEGQKPNTYTTFITMNGPVLSADMAQRSVVIELARPTYVGRWVEDLQKFIQTHQWEVVGDILAELCRPSPFPSIIPSSRWASWEEGVLSRCPLFEECQNRIKERQEEVDGDKQAADLMRDVLQKEFAAHSINPDTSLVFLHSSVLAVLYNRTFNTNLATNRVSGHMKRMRIPELKKEGMPRKAGARGLYWCGSGAKPDQNPIELSKLSL